MLIFNNPPYQACGGRGRGKGPCSHDSPTLWLGWTCWPACSVISSIRSLPGLPRAIKEVLCGLPSVMQKWRQLDLGPVSYSKEVYWWWSSHTSAVFLCALGAAGLEAHLRVFSSMDSTKMHTKIWPLLLRIYTEVGKSWRGGINE